MKTQRKKDYEDIFTVIIQYEGNEPTTVSFIDFDAAVAYCMQELEDGGRFTEYADDEEEEREYARNELENQRFFDDGGTYYYIEEARLHL